MSENEEKSYRMTYLGAVEVKTAPSTPVGEPSITPELAALEASGPVGAALVALFHAKTKLAAAIKVADDAEIKLFDAKQALERPLSEARSAEIALERLLSGKE